MLTQSYSPLLWVTNDDIVGLERSTSGLPARSSVFTLHHCGVQKDIHVGRISDLSGVRFGRVNEDDEVSHQLRTSKVNVLIV